MAQLVENDNMDQSHEYMREVESCVRKMSEHSLTNMLFLLAVHNRIFYQELNIELKLYGCLVLVDINFQSA